MLRVSVRKPTELTFRLMQSERPGLSVAGKSGIDPNRHLPDDWLVLLAGCPRSEWIGHQGFGPVAEMWLNRHDGFRHFANSLTALVGQLREGQIPADRFGPMFLPRLQQFLSELHSHNMIEDHQYFPALMAAEPQLVPGFECLESDHAELHGRMGAVASAANELLSGLGAGDLTSALPALDDFTVAIEALLIGLKRHLSDEEDLIIPILLSRAEPELNFA